MTEARRSHCAYAGWTRAARAQRSASTGFTGFGLLPPAREAAIQDFAHRSAHRLPAGIRLSGDQAQADVELIEGEQVAVAPAPVAAVEVLAQLREATIDDWSG